jgi:hypothetical protein
MNARSMSMDPVINDVLLVAQPTKDRHGRAGGFAMPALLRPVASWQDLPDRECEQAMIGGANGQRGLGRRAEALDVAHR